MAALALLHLAILILAGGTPLMGVDGVVTGNLAALGENGEGNRLTLLGPVAVVQVIKAARETLVESGLRAQSEQVTLADGPASSIDGACLSRGVELELEVGGDVCSPGLGVLEDTVRQSHEEGAIRTLL
jgi:hypothetical protein